MSASATYVADAGRRVSSKPSSAKRATPMKVVRSVRARRLPVVLNNPRAIYVLAISPGGITGREMAELTGSVRMFYADPMQEIARKYGARLAIDDSARDPLDWLYRMTSSRGPFDTAPPRRWLQRKKPRRTSILAI
jgi:hypothetical protein